MIKKILPLFLLLSALTAVHAQEDSRWTIGVKGGVMFGIHKLVGPFIEVLKQGYIANEESFKNFSAAAYVDMRIFNKLSGQLEVNFILNQGNTITAPGGGIGLTTYEFTYSSLDIPLLIRYDFFEKPLLGLEAGPYLSIHLGKLKSSNITPGNPYPHNKEEVDYIDINGLTYGFAVGTVFGYPLGPGKLFGNVRFIIDFNPVKVNLKPLGGSASNELLNRRGLFLMLGYEYSF